MEKEIFDCKGRQLHMYDKVLVVSKELNIFNKIGTVVKLKQYHSSYPIVVDVGDVKEHLLCFKECEIILDNPPEGEYMLFL